VLNGKAKEHEKNAALGGMFIAKLLYNSEPGGLKRGQNMGLEGFLLTYSVITAPLIYLNAILRNIY